MPNTSVPVSSKVEIENDEPPMQRSIVVPSIVSTSVPPQSAWSNWDPSGETPSRRCTFVNVTIMVQSAVETLCVK